MAIIDLVFDRHVVYTTHINKRRGDVVIRAGLRPEILKWLSQHAVRYQLMPHRQMQICILDNKKAMLFKLRWI